MTALTSATVSALAQRQPKAWQAATAPRFVDEVRTGMLPEPAFNTWLVQDYLFVADLLVFQARLLGRAPRAAQAVLAAGLVGLEAELGWFESHATRRGLDLTPARRAATEQYRQYLAELDQEPYLPGICALWAIERVYLEAWRAAAPAEGGFAEFVEHWTTPGFGDYVDGLAHAADLALGQADSAGVEAARQAVVHVTALECDFWELPWATP